MEKNGNPEPLFYTDEERTLFLVTLPCHPDIKVTKVVTKVVTKSGTKITHKEIDKMLNESLNFKLLGHLLNNDITDVKYYLRKQLAAISLTKVLTKLLTKLVDLIDFLHTEKTREELLSFLEMGNQTKNFNTNIKPLIDNEIIEMTIPDKPKSRNQKYRLTVKGEKLLK